MSDTIDEALTELADAHGVATWYEDGDRRRVDVDRSVVVAVLAQLGVDAGSDGSVRQELAEVEERRAASSLPDTLVVRHGEARRIGGHAVVRCEDGSSIEVDGELGPDVPLGWHVLETGGRQVHLLVAPPRLPEPPSAWGWALQLYAARSDSSWGMGDLADLRGFVRRTGEDGAGLVLLNPVQAITPVLPIVASPYSPSSRRFANPLYLSVPDLPAYAGADADVRAKVDGLRPVNGELIDYDAVWSAKQAALELLWPLDERPQDDPDLGLRDFATFCALAEKYGPNWREWPLQLRHPAAAEVRLARSELADRVRFHTWLQRSCDEQLAEVHRAAREAGMPVGIVHDLPVGAGHNSADAWAMQDSLAVDVRVGAPPDAFNQQGQDWGLPPWRPDRLAAGGYAPYREMLRTLLRHSDGIRVDHVAGLWRLWWIPPGEPPTRGTYVRYDAEAMLGALALEAHRAGAVVVGEDLGTVSQEVTTGLRDRNMLTSAVLWFACDEDAPGQPLQPPRQWPAKAMASITTHDLPTAAGFLRGEHVRARAELGVLAKPVEEERATAARERDELLALLVAEGLVDDDTAAAVGDADAAASDDRSAEEAVIVAMHALLARTPCRLIVASPYDALGEPRQPNQPGTIDEYPNWRIPLPVTIDGFADDPRVRAVVAALNRRNDDDRTPDDGRPSDGDRTPEDDDRASNHEPAADHKEASSA